MRKLAFAGLGLLIILALVAPWLTGSVTASSWAQLNQELNSSGGALARLETVEYDQGYLSTDVLSKLVLTVPEVAEPVAIYLRSTIAHGIFGARSETRLDPQLQSVWLAYFDQDQPLLVTSAGLSGDIDGRLTVPAVSAALESDGQLDFRPLDVQFAVTDDASLVHLTLAWDGLALSEGSNTLELGQVSLTEELARLTGELWTGNVAFTVSDLSSETAAGNSLTLQGVTLAGSTREVDDSRLKNQVDLAVDNILLGGEPFGDLRLAFVADQFDIEATDATLVAGNRLNEAAAGTMGGSTQAVEQLKLFGEFMNALRNLMAQGLNLGIPTLMLNTPEGVVRLQFSFVHPPLEKVQRDNMISLFQHSQGGLMVEMPAPLVDKMPADFQQQLNQLYQQGLIQEVQGQLLLDIELDQMTLTVNGHAIAIPPII